MSQIAQNYFIEECIYTLPSINNYTHIKFEIHFEDAFNFN